MIEAVKINKSFDKIKAIEDISLTIRDGQVFGLIGTNGAGKSTLMRMVAGIMMPDSGRILIDDIPVYECPAAKKKFFYISDEQFFFANSTPKDMAIFYGTIYEEFKQEKFYEYLSHFEL